MRHRNPAVSISTWLADWRGDRLGAPQWAAAALALVVAATAYCLLSGLASGTSARPILSVAWGATMVLVPLATCAVLRYWWRRSHHARWGLVVGCLVIVAGGIAGLVAGEKLLALFYWGRPWGDFFAHFVLRSPLGLLFLAIAVLPAWLRSDMRARTRTALAARPESPSAPVVLAVATRLGERRLVADQVLRAQAAGNYVELHTAGESHLIRATLSSLARQLGQSGFVRVHRSALVNSSHVSHLDHDPNGEWRLHMADGAVVRVGRRYRAAVELMMRHRAHQPANGAH